MTDDTRLVRADEIAQFFGLNVRRVQQLTQEGIIKSVKADDGKRGRMYDYLPTIRALALHYRDKPEARHEVPDEIDAEKFKMAKVNRELAELKLAAMKGDLHHSADIKKAFGALFERLRSGLLSLPLGVAPLLLEQTDINVIADIITERLHRCMSEIAVFDFDVFAAGNSDYIDEVGGDGPTEE